MLTAVKQLGKDIFGAAGLEIRRKRPASDEPPQRVTMGMAGALRHLAGLGFQPATVIDVGVATQTADLYDQFPRARFLLVEPLSEFEPSLRRICANYNAQYVLAAAGEAPGTAVINVHADKFGSSLFKEVEGASVDGVPREVPVITLDQACAEKNLSGPYLLKVDVQGAELRVLGGARRVLRETEAVILEVTLFGTMVGGPQLADMVGWMKQVGFVVYDTYGFHYRPFDNALCQMDMVFVREDGIFRQSHVYATPAQRLTANKSLCNQFNVESEKAQR